MEQKSCRVVCRMGEEQKRCVVEAARRLGLSVSEFVTRAVGMYLYADGRGEPLRAVTFGEWLLVYHDLAGVDDALRDCARQLSATRQVASVLADRGALSERQASEFVAVVRSCHTEIMGAHREVSGCVETLGAMRDSWVATDMAGVPVGSPMAVM